MTDQPEYVGFEAYFETKDFEEGMKRFLKGLSEIRSGMAGFEDALTDMGADAGKKAGITAGESLLSGILGAVLHGGGIERVGSSIGAALGAAIGSSVAPGIGTTIGASVGGAFGGGALIATLTGAGIGAIIGSVVPGLGTALGAAIGGVLVGAIAMAIKSGAQMIINAVSKVFAFVGRTIKAILTPIGNFITALFEGAFNKVKQVFGSLANEFERLVGKVADLQQIEAGLAALVRSALVVEGQFENAADAIEAAVPITEKLSEALTDIALTSPFTVEQINEIFRVNTAFGISLGMSLKLTKAMIDFGAATGFGAHSLNLIARNLAQIAKFGQVYRRDIYQLANAGIDLAQIVRTEMGMSIEELNVALAEGSVITDDLLDAFIAFGQTNFSGSAEALSLTINGLQNRFETLKTLIMQDFLTPFLEKAAAGADILLQAFGAVLKSGVFESIGETFAEMFESIFGMTDWTVEGVATKIMEFILWLAKTANVMAEYGFGMMEAWGFGMLQGAFQAISAVANFISRVITKLFSTHSPPKILPIIDVWGAETIEAWLDGMTEADFGVINKIISPLEQILGNLGLDDSAIMQNVQNVVRMLSGSLETGTLDESLFSFLGDISGPFGDALKELTQLELNLAQAIKEVSEAQEALNAATEMYDDADETVRKLVREYNNLLRAGASDEVLDAKLAEIRAAQDQREEAAKLIEEREEELELAKENKEEAEDAAGAQREMVNLMIRLTKSTKEMEQETKKLGRSLRNAREEFEKIAGGEGDWESVLADLDTGLDGLLDGLVEEIEIQLWILYMQFDRWWNEVKKIFTEEESPFKTMVKDINNLIDVFEEVGGVAGIAEGIMEQWELFNLWVKRVWQNIQLAYLWLVLLRVWLNNPLDLGTMIDLGTKIGNVRDKLGETKGAIDDLEENINRQTDSVFPELGTALVNVKDDFGEVETGVKNVDGAIGDLETDTGTLKTEWASAWQDMKNKLNTNESPIKTKLQNIGGALSGIAGTVSGMLSDLDTFLTKLANAVIPPWLQQDSPSPIEMALMGMRDSLASLASTELPQFTAKMKLAGSADDLVNFRPTPTSAFTPSAINNNSVNNTFNMGGNVVRDDMDLAVIRNDFQRTLRQATYGA